TLGAVGLPGTSGFVGEFLTLVGAFLVNTWLAFFAATGLILGAMYMLYLYRRVIFDKLVHEDLKGITDLNWREAAIMAPLVLMVLWMGINPGVFLDSISGSVAHLLDGQPIRAAADGATVLQAAQR